LTVLLLRISGGSKRVDWVWSRQLPNRRRAPPPRQLTPVPCGLLALDQFQGRCGLWVNPVHCQSDISGHDALTVRVPNFYRDGACNTLGQQAVSGHSALEQPESDMPPFRLTSEGRAALRKRGAGLGDAGAAPTSFTHRRLLRAPQPRSGRYRSCASSSSLRMLAWPRPCQDCCWPAAAHAV
jgi:hypothetical protein